MGDGGWGMGEAAVQKCKSAGGRWKGAEVKRE
jgi:hypothetical protein